MPDTRLDVFCVGQSMPSTIWLGLWILAASPCGYDCVLAMDQSGPLFSAARGRGAVTAELSVLNGYWIHNAVDIETEYYTLWLDMSLFSYWSSHQNLLAALQAAASSLGALTETHRSESSRTHPLPSGRYHYYSRTRMHQSRAQRFWKSGWHLSSPSKQDLTTLASHCNRQMNPNA